MTGQRTIHDPGVHKPMDDDGVTYCGWAGDGGVYGGCGEVWPCSTVRDQQTPPDTYVRDHPIGWTSKYVKAKALREAAVEFSHTASDWSYGHEAAVTFLNARADEIEET